MKVIAAAAQAAIEDGSARIGSAVAIECTDPVRVWSGLGVLPLDGADYLPLGDRELAIAGGASLGGVAQNMTLTLSGLEPEVLRLLEADSVRDAPVIIWTLIFDSSGTEMLDAFVYRRGRVDRLPVRETSGGTVSVSVEVESPGRGLGRRTGRMRSDADQRLIDPDDGGMRMVSFAAEKNLYWGGRRPSRAGAVLGGGAYGGLNKRDYMRAEFGG